MLTPLHEATKHSVNLKYCCENSTKFMAISNEEGPILVGALVGFDDMNGSAAIPVIRTEDGQDRLVFGIVVPYNAKLKRWLETWEAKERFSMLGALMNGYGAIRDMYKILSENKEKA